MSRRWIGFVLVVLSAVCWSSAGLFVRLTDLDAWTIVGWRSLFAGLALAAVLALRGRGERGGTFGAAGWGATLLVSTATVAYIAALTLTTVANVLLIYACLPLVAAGLARLILGEPLSPRVLAAGACCLAGVAIVVGGPTGSGHFLGSVLALLKTSAFGGLLIIVKSHPGLDVVKVNTLGCLLCAVAALPFMSRQVPDPKALSSLALLGIVAMALAFLLFLEGGRRIPTGEAGLISLLDVVLGPLWVWLAFGEAPGSGALAGGALIIAALAWYLRRPQRDPAPAGQSAAVAGCGGTER